MLEQLNDVHPWLPPAAGAAILLVAAVLSDLVVKRLLLKLLHLIVWQTRHDWDDELTEQNVFGRLSQVLPALVIYIGVEFVPGIGESLPALIRNVAMGYVVLMLTLTLSATLSAANRIYERQPIARARPLKGVVQIVQIVVFVLGGVLIIAALLDRSPTLLLSGFGAMTAILLLVFRDTILGLVASLQLSAHDMARVGDWIEMPQFDANGDVIDVALHTVKVQNWDKTITTIPTYKLISESFRNWRGMSESGGRRIKRPLHIDQSSIRFLEKDEIDRFKRFALLKDYIARKQKDLDEHYAALGDVGREHVNRRRLTNIGMFRAYVFNYVSTHPRIDTDKTLLVRQLEPGPEGLPIEIYCFTATTAWAEYEDIQGDIFDHIIAILPEFGLKLYQKPAGSDVASFTAAAAGRAADQPAG